MILRTTPGGPGAHKPQFCSSFVGAPIGVVSGDEVRTHLLYNHFLPGVIVHAGASEATVERDVEVAGFAGGVCPHFSLHGHRLGDGIAFRCRFLRTICCLDIIRLLIFEVVVFPHFEGASTVFLRGGTKPALVLAI